MKAATPIEAFHREPRRAAEIVTNPRLVVVDSQETADPGAIADALEVLVKWALRAHARRDAARSEAPSSADVATCGIGDPT